MKVAIVLCVVFLVIALITNAGSYAEANASEINANIAAGGRSGIELPTFEQMLELATGQ